MPNGQVADFSTHNAAVSIAAPGASPCRLQPRRVLDDPGQHDLDRVGRHERSLQHRLPAPTCANPLARPLRLRRGHELLGADRLGRRGARTPGQPAAHARRRSPTSCAARRTQTVGKGWNEYAGAGIVDAAAAVSLARLLRHRAADGHPEHGGQARRGRRLVLSANDAANAGEALAGGVTLGLDTSADGVTYTPLVLPGASSIHQLIPATRPVWVRATVCDANHNCTVHPDGPTVPLVPRAPPRSSRRRARACSCASSGHAHRKLQRGDALGKGSAGQEPSCRSSRGRARRRARSTASASASARRRTITQKVAKTRALPAARARDGGPELPRGRQRPGRAPRPVAVARAVRLRTRRPSKGLEVLLDEREELRGVGAVDQAVVVAQGQAASSAGSRSSRCRARRSPPRRA